MATITNNGTINYTINGETLDLQSNTVATDLNVSYQASMTKTASPTQFIPGDVITYQLLIKNTGSGTLYNPGVSDNLGEPTVSETAPLTYVTGSASAYLYDSTDTVVTPLDITSITVGSNVEFTVSGTIPEGYYVVITYRTIVNTDIAATATSITNTAVFTANEGGISGAEYTVSASETITRDAVSIVKAATPDSVNPGDTLTYTFTLTNIENEPVTINTLTDQLPAAFDIADTITVRIGATTVTYTEGTDYTVTDGNLLVISPAAASTPLSIPAATAGDAGITTITIIGTIVA